jgi:hypothetical protein
LISVSGLGCSFLTIAGQFFIRQVRASKDATFLASSRRGFARPASIFGLVFGCVGPVLFLLPASTSRAPGFHSASQIFGLRARFQVACPVLSVFIVFLLSSPLRLGSLHPAFLFARRSAPQFFVRFFLQSFSAVSAQECAPGSVSLARFQGAQKVLRFPRTGSGSYSVSGPRSPVRPSFRFRPDSVLVLLRSAVATTSFCSFSFCFLFLPPEEQPAINFVRKWSYS